MADNANKPGPTVRIRPATPDDYDQIAAVWHAAGLSVRPTGRDTKDQYFRQLEQFPTTFLVAVEASGEPDGGPTSAEGHIVGVVLGTHDGRKGWINRLAVHPDQQRQGLAVGLIAACDAAIRACGIGIVAALVEPENESSLRVFRRAGYVDDAPVIYLRKLDHPDI